jgi:hypothetical protein
MGSRVFEPEALTQVRKGRFDHLTHRTPPPPLATLVSALGISLRTIERVRKRFVPEGFEAALDHRPQPPRPDKIKIKGNVEQRLLELACSDPPRGRCHWTLQLLADELVVLGLVDTISTVTVWQALKKTRPANCAKV